MPVYMWITKYGEGQGGNSNDLPKSSCKYYAITSMVQAINPISIQAGKVVRSDNVFTSVWCFGRISRKQTSTSVYSIHCGVFIWKSQQWSYQFSLKKEITFWSWPQIDTWKVRVWVWQPLPSSGRMSTVIVYYKSSWHSIQHEWVAIHFGWTETQLPGKTATEHQNSVHKGCTCQTLNVYYYTIVSDLCVFSTFVQSCRNTSLGQCNCRNELEKQRVYDGRVKGAEHGIFSPLVFSTTDGMWNTTSIVYKLIASLIADKQNKPYSKTLHKLRCRLSFRCSFQRSCAVEVVCAVGLWLKTLPYHAWCLAVCLL